MSDPRENATERGRSAAVCRVSLRTLGGAVGLAALLLATIAGLHPYHEYSDHKVSLAFGVFATLVAFGALADVRAILRVPATILPALACGILSSGRDWDPNQVDHLLMYLLLVGGVLTMAIAVLVPVRLYVGTIGLPRSDGAVRGPSIAGLLGATAYFAFTAAMLTSALVVKQLPYMIVPGLIASAIALGSPLLLLDDERWMRIVGAWVFGGSILAAYLAGFLIAGGHLAPLAPFLAVPHAAEILLPMLAATYYLRANGFRMRR